MKTQLQLDLLLVEDNDGHARLIEKNLRRSYAGNSLTHVSDGQEAIDYIRGRGRHEGTPHVSNLLVLLDLNLPVMDGFEVLRRLKSDPATSSIPVIILTTTDDQHEVRRCYELGCNLYVTKPVDYEQFTEAIHKLGLILSVITLPNQEAL
jgi:CheY-like chemotaxis protein